MQNSFFFFFYCTHAVNIHLYQYQSIFVALLVAIRFIFFFRKLNNLTKKGSRAKFTIFSFFFYIKKSFSKKINRMIKEKDWF